MLFVGSVGINIFKHACLDNDVSVSFFVQNEHECSKHEVKLDACCHSLPEKDHGCCNDIVQFFKIDLDFFETNEILNFVSTKPTPNKTFLFELFSIGFQMAKITHQYDEPPPHSSNFLRIRNQRFII
jgi:hypothetical protein